VVLALSSANLFAGDVLHFSGVVKDPTGAVVAHAQISVVNDGTDARKSIVSDGEGWYELLLPAGNRSPALEYRRTDQKVLRKLSTKFISKKVILAYSAQLARCARWR
jgi:hypothetical protein